MFDDEGKTILFWVAARGHHTDIGGLGGNPHNPAAIVRQEEGVSFESTFAVRDGVFNDEEIVEAFMRAGDFPGCKATKRLDHNISDIKAQCSACAVGTTQLHALFDEYGKDVVHFYMKGKRSDMQWQYSADCSHPRQCRGLHPRCTTPPCGQGLPGDRLL